MKHSEQLQDLAAALCKAQAAMTGAKKDSTNPFFKSNYADLESVWDACRKPLTDNGLSIVQMPVSTGEQVGVATMMLHSSGQWIIGEFALVPAKLHDPQAIGSVITYFRRYGLAGAAGIYQTDDDANAATPTQETRPAQGQAHNVAPQQGAQLSKPAAVIAAIKGNGSKRVISEPQAKRFFAMSKSGGWTQSEITAKLKEFGFNSSKEITSDRYEQLCEWVVTSPPPSYPDHSDPSEITDSDLPF